MNNQDLEIQFGELVKTERKIMHRLLRLMNEIENRKLHLQCYSSMHDYLVRGHGYSEGAAGRRVAAARLLRDVPEVGEKLQSAAVNLSTLSQAQKIMREEEKRTGTQLSAEQKSHVISKIENKSFIDAQKQLFEIFPEAQLARKDVIQTTGANTHRLSADISTETKAKLDRVKELLSHVSLEASIDEILGTLAETYLEKNDPLRKTDKPVHSDTESVPVATHRFVKQRDQAECQWQNKGTKCRSRFQIEVDHIVPRAKGGSHDPANLRCLCRVHNQFYAQQIFGRPAVKDKLRHPISP